ncbi:MAG: hypothetical protein ACI8UO_000105 [Verrucomicrobiales bacterium]|jgi:hypothetical protein
MRSIFRAAGCLAGPIFIGLAFLISFFVGSEIVPILEVEVSCLILGFGILILVSQILSLAFRFTLD